MTLTAPPAIDLGPIRELYPFVPQALDLPAGRLSYLDEGRGPVVLLLHGNPTWSFYYRRMVLALRPHFRVIVPDHLGCGLSAKPQDYSYHLNDHIENLAALLEHLAIREAAMVVHDWGGPIGLGCAVRRVFRLRSLVLLNTAAFLSPRIPLRIALCQVPLVGDVAIRGFNAFAGLTPLMAVEKPMDPLVRQGYLLPYRSWQDRIGNLRFVQDIPMYPAHPGWALVESIDRQLATFHDIPVSIFWGGKDWCFSDYFLQEWLVRFPHAEVWRFDDAGHFVLEDAHAELIPRALHFLQRSAGA